MEQLKGTVKAICISTVRGVEKRQSHLPAL